LFGKSRDNLMLIEQIKKARQLFDSAFADSWNPNVE